MLHKIKMLIVYLLLLIFTVTNVYSQKTLQNKNIHLLDSLSKEKIPRLNSKFSLSVSNVPIRELFRAIAKDSKVNISLASDLNLQSSVNFQDVNVKDILSYLCNENNLLINNVGNILHISYPPKPIKKEKPIIITYDKIRKLVSYDLRRDRLDSFIRQFADSTGVNVMLSPLLTNYTVDGFCKELSLKKSLSFLAHSNNLFLKEVSSNVYLLEKKLQNRSDSYSYNSTRLDIKDIHVSKNKGISLSVKQQSLKAIFENVLQKSNIKYRIFGNINARLDLDLKDVDVYQFLYHLTKGSEYTYKFQGDICYLGNRSLNFMKTCEVIKLYERSVLDLSKKLPNSTSRSLRIKEFAELNSLFLSGYSDEIFELKSLIHKVDKRVPVVLIDVMIIDITNSNELSFGLTAGVGEKASKTSGTIYPYVDATFSSSSINNTLNNIGLSSLGKLAPNVYVKLKALDEAGKIDIKSTPRLSTLNSHEAKIKIGKKEYYKELRNSYWGTQDPQLSQQVNYKPVEANLQIKIRPIITGDGSVTMKIFVEQSDFTERITKEAPPGLITRQFESMIRVMNGETILLGGLEVSNMKRENSGLPLISRIPILRWIFGSSTKKKSKTRLNIIIKPTIIN